MTVRLSYRRGSFRLIEQFAAEREAIVRASRLRLSGDCSEFVITGKTGNRLWGDAEIGRALSNLTRQGRREPIRL